MGNLTRLLAILFPPKFLSLSFCPTIKRKNSLSGDSAFLFFLWKAVSFFLPVKGDFADKQSSFFGFFQQILSKNRGGIIVNCDNFWSSSAVQ